VPPASTSATLRTLDGLHLATTLVTPDTDAPPQRAIIFVHGGGVTRDEAGVASLRFDLRGHGESEGRQEDLTLAAILSDIRVAVEHVRDFTNATAVSLLGTPTSRARVDTNPRDLRKATRAPTASRGFMW
jgi:pimeloyl-ACP methyl ester carboxylesterase